MDDMGETAEVGELPEGDDEAVVVSALPVPRVFKSCDSRGALAFSCGVAVARKNAKGGESVDDMLPSPPRAG
jgi:hypothetical protein